MKKQISDSISCGVIMALSGGCMDAYSYLVRDEVFSNAQTGNMLLCGINIADGNFAEALKYLWPILAFIAGIVLSDIIRSKINAESIHWRQLVVGIEAVALLAVAFIPQTYNSVATTIISLACGMQVESFRKIHGNSIATTMCIGNLRSGTYYFDKYIASGDKQDLKKSVLYFGIILSFVIGAIIESALIPILGYYSICLSSLLLVVALVYMFRCDSADDGETYIEG